MRFDITKSDSQATEVLPISPEKFDLNAYADYEKSLSDKCTAFWNAPSGVAVYRRMRAAEVFAAGSRDMKRSLELQLGCLQKSMEFKADIPNFLEPWYGIGVAASAYGIEYAWGQGLAPAVHARFATVADALQYTPTPIAKTSIGKHTLDMIDYFLDQTKGKLPISYTDAQSPLNVSTLIVNNTSILMDILMDPESVNRFLNLLADLTIDFVNEQKRLIGECLVNPGHGFASTRHFSGYGQSDDNVVMLSCEQYIDCALPSFERIGQTFGGPVFHSCGDWSDKIPAVKQIQGLRMVDGAFSPETDPNPNPATPFAEAFAGSGIVLNARIVGSVGTIEKTVRELWQPGMKLIVVTYCETPEEQKKAYDLIHEICV
ncbi:hypothetical protein FACS1894182_13010 [Bacteroidia bacterium]|nr:hypothetical protein FACS1894182_13010 [Bacteroidia bacterium]